VGIGGFLASLTLGCALSAKVCVGIRKNDNLRNKMAYPTNSMYGSEIHPPTDTGCSWCGEVDPHDNYDANGECKRCAALASPLGELDAEKFDLAFEAIMKIEDVRPIRRFGVFDERSFTWFGDKLLFWYDNSQGSTNCYYRGL